LSGASLERLVGSAASEKLTALAWNRDPRQIQMRHRSHSAGAQSALGLRLAHERVYRPVLAHLADRIGRRLRAKSLAGRTVTARVRFADLRSITRSTTLAGPIAATASLTEVGTELVRAALADHPQERHISLVALSVSHLERHPKLQYGFSLGLVNEARHPGTRRGQARLAADRAMDTIRDRFGRRAIGYGAAVFEAFRSVPDEFRELAEKDL
jgi:DNA polymerase-4